MKPFLQPVWLALGLLCGPVLLCAADYDIIVSGDTSGGYRYDAGEEDGEVCHPRLSG